MSIIATFLGLTAGLAVLVLVLIAFILVFEIWMFIDVIQNDAISSEVKLLWIIGMFLLHPIVAIGYFFTDHRKRL